MFGVLASIALGLVLLLFARSVFKSFRDRRAELNVAFVASRDENPVLFWAYSAINFALLISGLVIIAMLLSGRQL